MRFYSIEIQAVSLQHTHGSEAALVIRLLDHTQEAIDPLKVHYSFDAKCPETVLRGRFVNLTNPVMQFTGRSGGQFAGRGAAGGGRGWTGVRF